MARCSICDVKHSRWRDKAHTKPASYCSECHALKMRLKYRPHYAETLTALIGILCHGCREKVTKKLHVDHSSHRRNR